MIKIKKAILVWARVVFYRAKEQLKEYMEVIDDE